MSKNPLITVIVPVYNVEKYIERCVESIINQTYRNLEIILIDDGSPDNSPKICDDYSKKDRRIRVVHKENGGLSDARNKGIEIAKGEYISFVDSDDWIEKNMYDDMIKIAIEKKADIVTCDIVRKNDKDEIKDDKRNLKEVKEYTQEEYMKKFFRISSQKCVCYAVNKLYKKDMLENDQYPVGLTCEDVYGTYKAIEHTSKIIEIDYPYYNYYINPNSITERKFSKTNFDLLKVWDLVVKKSKDNNNEKYYEWALINRKRSNFTLLVKMAQCIDYKIIQKEYKNEYLKLKKELNKDMKVLLKANISKSRKLMIVIVNYFYRQFCYLIKRR